MPIIQIDWQEIKEKFGDVTAIYAFTHRQASLLLSLSEQLSWEKTFREFGYDFDDKDDLDWDIEDLRNNLVSPVDLTDVIQYIDDVETILNAILAAQSANPGCCPDGVYYEPVEPIPDFDTVPQPIVDAGYATDTDDLEGYYDYRCMAGNLFFNNVQNKLVELTPIIAGGFALFNILAGLFTFLTAGIGPGAVIVIAGLAVESSAIIALVNSLKDISSILPSDWAEDLEDCRDEIICAMQMADGQEAVKTAFLDGVESCLGAAPRLVIANLNLDPMLQALWYGQSNGVDVAQRLADEGFDATTYDCECEEELEPHQLIQNPNFDAGADHWTINSGKWSWVSSFGGASGVMESVVEGDIRYYLFSDSFTTSADYTKISLNISVYSQASRFVETYVRLFRTSDNAVMGTLAQGSQMVPRDNTFHLCYLNNISVAGSTQYYVGVGHRIDSGTVVAGRVNYVKAWESA